MTGPVVALAGGTGGAKLAAGLAAVLPRDELVVVANTGDDTEIYGAHVSPDPDLVSFWLADRIDARGWGLDGDTFHVMDGLRELGVEVWFNLGDRDLAYGIERARRLAAGDRLTDALADLGRALGLPARVLPMSDDPVRTHVRAQGREWPFQEFMIVGRAAGPVEGLEFRGAESARPTPEVLEAVASARAIVIGPSNPLLSIGPILALPGLREALGAAAAPVVAVSPIVGGQVVKGPTAAFLEWAGQPLSAGGVAALYGDLLDGIVSDEPLGPEAPQIPVHTADLLMSDGPSRERLARATLAFAATLAG
ncbi:2-phospho-L-lactate transferase [Conexibacter stalactiti]|uniref:2-phospho-L-lactate transferase n=1 Tax=Conexibacter stalactiti TaxID=1940611 RepID=A0ABU4HT68_9ACTN|nr:2-phospho-L-lactate transferase [Conexibacter stalactiti]MDW5596513.1 2-phospho-L-lactate transferase [Conexibacter stalactiti]MEC5037155.1 2-phospho-L-lactate transferase [Conexibacter stalactiti]